MATVTKHFEFTVVFENDLRPYIERAKKKCFESVMCLGCIAFQSVYDKRDQMVSAQIRNTRL